MIPDVLQKKKKTFPTETEPLHRLLAQKGTWSRVWEMAAQACASLRSMGLRQVEIEQGWALETNYRTGQPHMLTMS